MEDKQFNLTTLDDIQKKVDKMPFQLTLLTCALVIITFFIVMLIVQLDTREYVKDSVSSTEYLIEKLEKSNVIEKEIF